MGNVCSCGGEVGVCDSCEGEVGVCDGLESMGNVCEGEAGVYNGHYTTSLQDHINIS